MVRLVESNFWEDFRTAIKTKLHGESFETWFNPISLAGIDQTQQRIRLRAPNTVVRDWVKSHYATLIDESFSDLSLSGYSVDWLIADESPSSEATPVQPVAPIAVASVINEAPAAFSTGAATAVAPAKQTFLDPALNSKYTFESFVVGSCNQFAHAASQLAFFWPSITSRPSPSSCS